ncbi:MAG: 50S ribosomal protein L6 [Candidatus Omnitrophota bacterium]
MSRIGKKPVQVPKNVKVSITGSRIHLEGPKGKLDCMVPERFKIEFNEKNGTIALMRPSDSKPDMSTHGLVRALLFNAIKGVADGFEKTLNIQGVGYRAQVQGKALNMQLGFSHPVEFLIPEGITIEAPKPTTIIVKGIDKARVGEAAAEIRSLLPPEPYKGKGIRYEGEYVRKKAGKAVV